MRLKLTVVDPYTNAHKDLVLDADPETRIDAVARELAARVRGGAGAGASRLPRSMSTATTWTRTTPSPPPRCATAR